MKRTLLSIIAIAGLSTVSFGQIEIYVDGGATNYSGGGVLNVQAESADEIVHDIHFENVSNDTTYWIASRKRINDPASWSDFLCWGHEADQWGGLCIDAASMDIPLFSMSAGNVVTIPNGEAGLLASHIQPDPTTTATVTYRYYAGTAANPFMDSMDIVVNVAVGLEEVAPSLSVNVSPNPATDYINVSATGANNATIEIADVLGNVVLKESMVGSNKKVNVNKFRNGIYFVMVKSEGVKPVTRKVIVRH